MKLFATTQSKVGRRCCAAARAQTPDPGPQTLEPRPQTQAQRAFTMIEIAICLAIIGVALVGIIGVLPYGMNTQRDNRQETVIGQDAAQLMQLISSGSMSADDLTNYVYAIYNTGTRSDGTSIAIGYTNALAGVMGFSIGTTPVPAVDWHLGLTNGANIVGLMTTPEFIDANTASHAIPNLNYGGISNHIVACVRAISGLAAEQPPQNNAIMVGDTFTYRIFCVNAIAPFDTNLVSNFQLWQPQVYPIGAQVFYNWNIWQASAPGAVPPTASDIPGVLPPPLHINPWIKIPFYPLELSASQHDVRLTFLWPVLPSGKLGSGRQTFRTSVAGQALHQLTNGLDVYFYQPQSFYGSP